MRVLIACEFSQIVTAEFRKRGHEAFSCDIIPTEGNPDWHFQCDVLKILDQKWDLMIAFPPCTHLCISGARWFKYKQKEQMEALNFVKTLMDAPIEKIAIENPKGIISTRIRKPDQILQPHNFGHPECKGLCLWLKNLPLLIPTNNVAGREHRIHKMYQSKTIDRSKERSRTYLGFAKAMANQWG